jgi:hypothetical protein
MKVILAALACVTILVTLLWSQITGGTDAIRARAGADEAMWQAYASQPGGATEENLFEVLVLMGRRRSATLGMERQRPPSALFHPSGPDPLRRPAAAG